MSGQTDVFARLVRSSLSSAFFAEKTFMQQPPDLKAVVAASSRNGAKHTFVDVA